MSCNELNILKDVLQVVKTFPDRFNVDGRKDGYKYYRDGAMEAFQFVEDLIRIIEKFMDDPSTDMSEEAEIIHRELALKYSTEETETPP